MSGGHPTPLVVQAWHRRVGSRRVRHPRVALRAHLTCASAPRTCPKVPWGPHGAAAADSRGERTSSPARDSRAAEEGRAVRPHSFPKTPPAPWPLGKGLMVHAPGRTSGRAERSRGRAGDGDAGSRHPWPRPGHGLLLVFREVTVPSPRESAAAPGGLCWLLWGRLSLLRFPTVSSLCREFPASYSAFPPTLRVFLCASILNCR